MNSNYFEVKNRKKKLTIEAGSYKIRIIRGYRGDVRNDFTIYILSKEFSLFLFKIKDEIKILSELPKRLWSRPKPNEWCNVAQRVAFVADSKAYKESDDSSGINEKLYSLEKELAPRESFYIIPRRLETFVVVLKETLMSPKETYHAVIKGGILDKNIAPWDIFYFLLFSALKADISFDVFMNELEKFGDYPRLRNLNVSAVEELYKLGKAKI